MTPSTLGNRGEMYVATIMASNGRWAPARGLPLAASHRAGFGAARRVGVPS